MNVRKNFLLRASKKTLYFLTVALAAIAVVGVFTLSDFNSSGTVSAQRDNSQPRNAAKVARPDMYAIAFDFGSAAEFAVFADKGLAEGNSRINGKSGVARNDEAGAKARQDMSMAFSAIEQLPCAEKTSELRRGSFAPGVYCASTADLAGEFVLDAKNNPGSIFVFRSEGSITTGKNLNISLINGAEAANVFFIAGDSATVGEGVVVEGNIVARNSISVGNGSTVSGKALSVDGKVTLNQAEVGPGTGALEICKNASALTLGSGLGDRIFIFRVGTQLVRVPYGSCTGVLGIPAGSVTIEELVDGDLIGGGTFSNRFRLIDVRSNVDGAITSVNLPLRRITANVRAGSIAQETVIDFINVFAIPAIVEICKLGARDTNADGSRPLVPLAGESSDIRDRDVQGFFDFTIDALPGQVFTVPATQTGESPRCSGPIQVLVPTTPQSFPGRGEVRITELAEEGFQLEEASTFPADRFNFIAFNVGLGNDPQDGTPLNNPVFFNPGGGIVGVDVLEGGAANSTIVAFFNRSRPGFVKVCKIAGPGIPEGRRFVFDVRGREPSDGVQTTEGPDAATAPVSRQEPGRILPGNDFTRDVTVPAGPAAQGGFCRFVNRASDGTGDFQRFIVGSQVLVQERGIVPSGSTAASSTTDPRAVPIDPVPGVPAGSPGGPVCTSPTSPTNPCPEPQTNPLSGVRVSRIRLDASTTGMSAGFESPATQVHTAGTTTLNPNPDLVGRRAIFRARRDFTTIEFTNFLFRPQVLKLCKVAGPGITGSSTFNFTVTIQNPGGLFATPSTVQPVSLTVNPEEGVTTACTLVNGPFSTTPQLIGTIGTFNVGSTVTIQETAVTGVTVSEIRPLSGTLTNIDLANRRTDLTFDARTVAGGVAIAEVEFVNTRAATPPAPVVAGTAFDFDGDGKADMSAFRPSNGVWYMLRSRDGFAASQFGTNGDQIAAADYDGDGKTDLGVYRNGTWYLMRSRDGFTGVQFGQAGDIPQAADFDGDGKADLAVFRPSNGVWYLLRSRDGFTAVQFGLNGDQPVAADFDGDGKADIAVFRNGVWHQLRSRDGYTGVQFGQAGDQPVAADYDGDRKADIGVFRGGIWHLLRSQAGYTGLEFGLAGDTPVPADYNGDGKTDVAVFRGGMWFILDSGQSESAGYRSVQFGAETDKPVPSSFR